MKAAPMRLPRHSLHLACHPVNQRGVASLVVVMLLLFVVSLSAAYASRNLIFEQKTSANQARSTLAFEAAEAGVEWTLAQLNGGRLDSASCANSATASSFQQRYLSIVSPDTPGSGTDGMISQKLRDTSSSPSADGNWWPTCTFDGSGWTCACPDGAAVDPSLPSAGTPALAAFRVWLSTREPIPATPPITPWNAFTPPNPGLLAISSVGCTRFAGGTGTGNCLSFQPVAEMGEGMSALRVLLALRSGLTTPPAAAITARLGIQPDIKPAKLRAINAELSAGGFTVNTGVLIGGAHKSQIVAESTHGSPAELSFAEQDVKLAALSTVAAAAGSLTEGERMFVSTFGMKRNTYLQQPGLRVRDAETIPDLLDANPRRIIWVNGDLTLDTSVGSVSEPVLLIVNGDNLTLSSGVTITGFVYVRGTVAAPLTPCTPTTCVATITLPDAVTRINGALMTEGALKTLYSGTPASSSELIVTYNRAVLDTLRLTYGSWVRVGGGWRDFKGT